MSEANHPSRNHPSTDGPRRRTLLGLGAAAGAAAVLPATAAIAAPAAARGKATRPGFAAAFASPGRAVRPKFRWWWPDGLVDPAEIAREVDQIADAGVRRNGGRGRHPQPERAD